MPFVMIEELTPDEMSTACYALKKYAEHMESLGPEWTSRASLLKSVRTKLQETFPVLKWREPVPNL